MGVPSFYRWISEKYPKIVSDVIEEQQKVVSGVTIPIDITKPNPNGREYDNLYLDMNGIIHPCTHPEDKAAPKSLDEMLLAIFEYIDRIVAIIRPRKILYMAIDGVAPRAKMNQQRSRRFRAAQEAKEKLETEQKVMQELLAEGQDLTKWNEAKESSSFDSNVITPGTEFMDKVARGLQYYISEKMTKGIWTDFKVILSDANSPGEGEHKIMDFIRRQRIQKDYNPQTSHVIYGLDADLLMLAIATHEPNFYILREMVFFGKNRVCHICNQPGHMAAQCQGVSANTEGEPVAKLKPYQIVTISVLREYLINDLKCKTPFRFDTERVLDDWVFLCFFVGNDFLPHLPTLKIREGALELLMDIYQKTLPTMNGYLTKNGEVNLPDVELIMDQIGELEDAILRTRRHRDERAKQNRKNNRKQESDRKRSREQFDGLNSAYTTPVPEDAEVGRDNRGAAKKLKASLHSEVKDTGYIKVSDRRPNKPNSQPEKKKEDSDDEESLPDVVKLGEDGWKERYYLQKFHVSTTDAAFRKQICRDYTEGLCWVMKYYYQGCASWNWYYPHHYAPFASDLVNLKELNFTFHKGTPFRPFEQLMGVLPALSGEALPKKCLDLMTNPESPILDFYPEQFHIDMDGCRFAWQGVALLPFIEESRLLEAMKALDSELTEEEKLRNSFGPDLLYVHQGHSIVVTVLESDPLFYKEQSEAPKNDSGGPEENPEDSALDSGHVLKKFALKAPECDNLFGWISPNARGAGVSNFLVSTIKGKENLSNNAAFCFTFHHPIVPEGHVWQATLLPNVKLPTGRLGESDFAKDRSYRFGQSMRNTLERSMTRFHDPRHQKTGNDRYQGSDYHGGRVPHGGNRGSYNNRGSYDRGGRNHQQSSRGDYDRNRNDSHNRNDNSSQSYHRGNQSHQSNYQQSRPQQPSRARNDAPYNPFGSSQRGSSQPPQAYQSASFSSYRPQTNYQPYTPYPLYQAAQGNSDPRRGAAPSRGTPHAIGHQYHHPQSNPPPPTQNKPSGHYDWRSGGRK